MAIPADLAVLPFLYLTTTGRVTGLAREIEIWFVSGGDALYVLAENGLRAHWVRNIDQRPQVYVRLGERRFTALAQVLDEAADAAEYARAQALSRAKYGWGDGLPVRIHPDTPLDSGG